MNMDPVIAHNAGQLLELVERSAFVGFWRLDARSGWLYWSEQLARLHGAPPGYTPTFEEAMRHYAPDHRGDLEARIRACQEHGTPFDIEVQLHPMQGPRLWVRCVGQALRDEHGAIVATEGIVQEIAPA